MVREYGNPPYEIVVLHGGPGAAGSTGGLARLLAKKYSVLEPMQSKDSIYGLVEELRQQIEGQTVDQVVLIGHSWGAWLAGIFAEKYSKMVKKVILIGCAPLAEEYVSEISVRRQANMTLEEQREYESILCVLEEDRRKKAGGEKSERLEERLEEIGDLEKSQYLCRLGEICDRADGYAEIVQEQEAVIVDGELYGKVWNEAVELRKTGVLLELFKNISCPVTCIQGCVDPHPIQGVTEPMRGCGVLKGVYVLEKCGHTPWKEKYAREEFEKVLFQVIEMGKENS